MMYLEAGSPIFESTVMYIHNIAEGFPIQLTSHMNTTTSLSYKEEGLTQQPTIDATVAVSSKCSLYSAPNAVHVSWLIIMRLRPVRRAAHLLGLPQ